MRSPLFAWLSLTVVLVVLPGCKKKNPVDAGSSAPSPSTAQTEASPATNAAANLPKLDTAVHIENIQGGTESAQKALSSHRLKDAVLALLKDDPKDLSGTQIEKRQNAIRQAQQLVAQAVSNGDPDAEEAAKILRAFSAHAR